MKTLHSVWALALIWFGLTTGLHAQALSGTKSVGPTGDYASLTAAIADIQTKTLGGALLLELQAAYVSGGETFPLVFTNLTTTAANTLTVRPQAGATALSITSAAAQTVNVNNGSFITFDGRPGGIGSARELTIENSSASGIAVQFIDEAGSNTLRFLNLRGMNTSTTGGIVVFGTSTGVNGNDNNTLDSCDLAPSGGNPLTNAVFSAGSSLTADNSGNSITACTIADFFSDSLASTGVHIGANNSAWTISGNRFFQTATRTYTTGNLHRALRVTSGAGHVISGNTIGYATAAGTGIYTMAGAVGTRFIGIDLAVSTTAATSVQGNLISGFSLSTSDATTSSDGTWCGVNVSSGSVNIGTSSANIIGGTSGVDLVQVVSTGSGALLVGMNIASAGTSVIQNNNLVSNTRSGGTGAHFAIANNYGATVSAVGWPAGAANHNVLNANAATVGHWGGNQTFTGWKSASGGDGSSYSGLPITFANAATDLHLAIGTVPTEIESGGFPIATVSTDFDAQVRPGPAGSVNGGAVFPDIGADEFDGALHQDLSGPSITVTPLVSAQLTDDLLTGVRIIDLKSGVPTTGGLRPRIYYRKGSGAWFSQPGAITSGTANDGL